MTECNICAEKYNNTTRSVVSCQYCQFEACNNCCKKYILSKDIPQCMNNECGKEWSRQFLMNNFTNSFITKEYKRHREEVLFNNEKALLPATQVHVERLNAIEKVVKERIELYDLIDEMKKRIRKLNTQHYRLLHPDRYQDIEVKAKFVRACPDPDCRGYLSTQWKCGLCNKWTCPDCHIIKGEERNNHTCNPDDIATAQLISKDTRPCPKCSMGIFKISGCSNMFCTQCHVGFDWNTGQIVTNIHNPHYYEWLRRNSENGEIPRNILDNPCGNDVLNHHHARDITNLIKSEITIVCNNDDKAEYVNDLNYIINETTSICEMLIHLYYVVMNTYRYNYLENNQELRIKYMQNKITEEQFKTLIQRREKKLYKNREISNIYNMFYTVGADIIIHILNTLRNRYDSFRNSYGLVPRTDINIKEIFNLLKQINDLTDYSNNSLKDISELYKSKVNLKIPDRKKNIIIPSFLKNVTNSV